MTDDRPQSGDHSATADTTDGQAPAAEGSVAASMPDPVPRRAEPAVLRIWASAELAVGCLAVVLIFVSVLWQVISRYVPALNWPGVGELGNYSLIVLTFIMVGQLAIEAKFGSSNPNYLCSASLTGGKHAASNYRSDHPGGCTFLMGDGSVAFLTEGIDMPAYQARSTISAEDIFSD